MSCDKKTPFNHFVQLLDLYFGSVCELDIIYNYEKVRDVQFIK